MTVTSLDKDLDNGSLAIVSEYAATVAGVAALGRSAPARALVGPAATPRP